MTKELAVNDQKYLDSLGGRGLDRVPTDILPIPRIRITQPSSKHDILANGEDAEPGSLFHTATQTSFQEIDCAVLRVGMSRALFEEVGGKSNLMCRSNDGRNGNVYGNCKECKFGQWQVEGGGEGEVGTQLPPECKASLDFLCLDDVTKKPFIISARGTSFAAGRKTYTSMLYSGKPAFAHKVKLESKLIKTDQYKYYVLVFRLLGLREVDEIRFLEEMYNEYAGKINYESETAAEEEVSPDEVVEGEVSNKV